MGLQRVRNDLVTEKLPSLNITNLFSKTKTLTSSAAAAKSLQLYPTVRPYRRQPTRLPVPGILQARTLEWVAIPFSSAWKWKVKVKSLSRVWLYVTPWTAGHKAPPSMGFSRQEYWSGVPLPSLRHPLEGYNKTPSLYNISFNSF